MADDALQSNFGVSPSPSRPTEPSVGELVTQLSEQSSKLLRSELVTVVAAVVWRSRHHG